MCIHHYGPVIRARFTGNATRTCERCGVSTMDIGAAELLADGARIVMTREEYEGFIDHMNRDGAEPQEDEISSRLVSVPHGHGATVEDGPYRAFLVTDEMSKRREECAEAVDGPGKFEGESAYAFHFYDAMLNGDGDEIYPATTGKREEDECAEMLYTRFTVEAEDIELFPELAGREFIRFTENDAGFWCEVEGDEYAAKSAGL